MRPRINVMVRGRIGPRVWFGPSQTSS